MNARRLAVHRAPRAYDLSAVRAADRLVSEADAEDGDRRAEASDGAHGNAGFGRRAWTRGDDDVRGRERGDLVERDGIVPDDDGLLAELADVSREVVDEGVVVVEEENHVCASDVWVRTRGRLTP